MNKWKLVKYYWWVYIGVCYVLGYIRFFFNKIIAEVLDHTQGTVQYLGIHLNSKYHVTFGQRAINYVRNKWGCLRGLLTFSIFIIEMTVIFLSSLQLNTA